ncbi:MAG: DUF423 domain-containing protein [Flavobacteriaceae bacterium]|nr:DUF423 domain-containing protein [Flavobacteriaceae bacterium]
MKINFTIASILGFLAVVLGAFGAHALKEKLSPEALNSFETGVRYMMYHTIVILFINSYSGFTDKIKNTISSLFFIGILFFSGSIFAISVGGVAAKNIWFITPLGGILLIFGWFIMILSFIRIKELK